MDSQEENQFRRNTSTDRAMQFNAIVVRESGSGFTRMVEQRSTDDLPAGDVLIHVLYSSLNYKDALSATGNRGVTRKYPHTPGIDAAGIVAGSNTKEFKEGDKVLVTGYDLGMNTSGGFGQYIRVPADWIIHLPKQLSFEESMTLGTAGFTAGLSLFKLMLNGLNPGDGQVLVTGATGGVGSLAVAILAKSGYEVVAATRKTDQADFLQSLGAKEIIHTGELQYNPAKPLGKGRWAGVVDAVGGEVLAAALASCKNGASVASCGMTLSPQLQTSVFPFILRGVNLLGINSAETNMLTRLQIWERLAGKWKPELPAGFALECSLEEVLDKVDLILQGKIRGRVLVKL